MSSLPLSGSTSGHCHGIPAPPFVAHHRRKATTAASALVGMNVSWSYDLLSAKPTSFTAGKADCGSGCDAGSSTCCGCVAASSIAAASSVAAASSSPPPAPTPRLFRSQKEHRAQAQCLPPALHALAFRALARIRSPTVPAPARHHQPPAQVKKQPPLMHRPMRRLTPPGAPQQK